MPDDQFARMRDILAAPSPIGLEAAMTEGVIVPQFEAFMPTGWAVHRFRGNAGVVIDTAPDATDRLTVMVIGHADKIRMMVRSIGEDGKIWIDSDSFLPQTLIGHEVRIFSEDPASPGSYRVIEGGTVEALGAIHFAPPEVRSGSTGIRKQQLYVELQLTGDDRRKQVEATGIRPGDSILLHRPIRRGFGPDSFYGAYLDNGYGCFATAEAARLIAADKALKHLRVLFAFAAYEEIGRFGSRVFAGELKPDVVIGVDVNHDFDAAPGVSEERYTPLKMGKGYTLAVGAIVSEQLNAFFQRSSTQAGIPFQKSPSGRDTGTDAMAGVLASIDAAATSIGVPIRNMHTISEAANTRDVVASIHGIVEALRLMEAEKVAADDFRKGHPRLDDASTQGWLPAQDDKD
ncbi:MAG: M20/M25/M40 family metallo-hydrolase [Deltaproteobacteria bacterium]|nr:MAG: M20/M25/M40 family metallo-hydrolase [Deltaproteobacteria bacterium]